MLLLSFDIARTGAGVKPSPTSILPSSADYKLATFPEVFLSLKYVSAHSRIPLGHFRRPTSTSADWIAESGGMAAKHVCSRPWSCSS